MARRRVAVVLLAFAVLAGLVALGRWERSRQVHSQIRGMDEVRRAVGPLDSPALTGYRLLPAFDCLVYGRTGNPFALELCVDPAGRVVEAIDRRRSRRVFYSLRADPAASSLRVSRDEVDRLLRKMHARVAR